MTTANRAGAALAAAFMLVAFGASPAFAHKAHEKKAAEAKQAAEAAREVSPPEPSVPVQPVPTETKVQPVPPEPKPQEPADPSESKPHDHADHSPTAPPAEHETAPDTPETNVPMPLAWLGKFHPPLTHFPIALLIAAAVAEFLFIRSGKPLFDHAARFSVWLGSGGAVAAALLGWLFGGFHFFDDEWVMTTHRWFGTATALWAGYLLVVSERVATADISRGRFRFVLFCGAALVSITGFLGGSLIYGLDHYAW